MRTDPLEKTSGPEVGLTLHHGAFATNFHDMGQGPVILLLHGSGPGVTAWANWRLIMPELAKTNRVIAPDIVGFGYTTTDSDTPPTLETWMEHLTSFLQALNVESVSVVGNSFGGALSLWLASRHPELVERIILMGSVGTSFELTPGLDAVWGYEPSLDAMEELLEYFVYARDRLPADLGQKRYEASKRAEAAEMYSSLFPAPRQRWIESLSLGADRLAALRQPTLVVHGREDQVIPMESSVRLALAIDNAQLHVFPHCGHWVQIERAADFTAMVRDFLSSPRNEEQ